MRQQSNLLPMLLRLMTYRLPSLLRRVKHRLTKIHWHRPNKRKFNLSDMFGETAYCERSPLFMPVRF